VDSAQIMNIISLIILLILSSLFSCSETAFLSVSKIKIRTLAEEGNKKAKLVESLLDDQDRLLSAILVGNNLVNIGASSLTTATIMAIFGDGAQTVAIATGVVTLCILIFGEITPKSLATQNADKLVFALAPFIRFVCVITKPVVFVLNIITGFIIKLLGGNQEHGPSLTEEELKTIVTVGHEEGVLEKEEKEMIHNVFEFGETEIKEIMTPRIHVESLPDDCTYDELMNVYHDAQYSRYPIHDESFDEIIGVLNMKDLLFIDIDKEYFDVKKYMRETFVVYEFNQVNDVFASMRKEHATLAIVLDEYGVMSGIVTFEDIVEEIVGEIDDEYDDASDDIVKINDHEYLVDGSLNLNEVNDEIDTHFESEDFESIGGLVLGEFSGVPKIKDKIEFPGVTIIIEKMHKNRIELLRLIIHEMKEEEEGEEKHQ
jgi:putative hemolysin